MARLLHVPEQMHLQGLQFGISTHFHSDVPSEWTLLEADTGASGAIRNAAGGGIDLIVATTNNAEVMLHTDAEMFKFDYATVSDPPLGTTGVAQGKSLVAKCRMFYTEANTDDAAVIFGVKDVGGADSIVDGGLTPDASYSGAFFFKPFGSTTWECHDSITTANKVTILSATNLENLSGEVQTAGGGVVQELRIESLPVSATDNRISFWIGKTLVARHTGRTTASATEMQFTIGHKAVNASGNTETISVTDMSCHQLY